MKVLLLTRYGSKGASSRMRTFQFLPWLQSAGIECVVSPLFNDRELARKYQYNTYGLVVAFTAYMRRLLSLMNCQSFDLIWIEKESLPWWPAWVERLLLGSKPYVLDFDDAIFHNYDKHRATWVRCLYGRKIDRLMHGAHLVVAGNSYLAQRALDAGTPRVEVLPTVIDLARYTVKVQPPPITEEFPACHVGPRIVWIGSPSTVQYLSLIAEPLAELAKRKSFVLRLIGSGALNMPGVHVEVLPWSADTEASLIAECDLGIMPLLDSPWEQGKCGYKLIQYMACGLPVVASAVGVNQEIVKHGVNGYLASTSKDWFSACLSLISDAEERQTMGRQGRLAVEEKYCLQVIAPRLVQLFQEAVEQC